jgi:hypothetical protein
MNANNEFSTTLQESQPIGAATMSHTAYPKIRKAALVRGETLVFRDACASDAEFILSLRTDENKSRFLSATKNDLDAQKAWLLQYGSAEDQAYFIIEFNDEPIGTVRLYDAQQESFCWGHGFSKTDDRVKRRWSRP